MEREALTQEELQKKLEALPEDLRDLIYNGKIEEAVQKIGSKHQLHIDQIGFFETEVMDVLLGVTEPADFVPYLAETLEISAEKAQELADEAEKEIFIKIRESMKQIGQDSPEQQASAPIAAAKNFTPEVIRAPEVTMQVPATPPSPKQEAPQMPLTDMMLTQKTVVTPATIAPTTASATTPTPATTSANYKVDPYREPPE